MDYSYQDVFTDKESKQITEYIRDQFLDKIDTHSYADVYTALLKLVSIGIYEGECDRCMGTAEIEQLESEDGLCQI